MIYILSNFFNIFLCDNKDDLALHLLLSLHVDRAICMKRINILWGFEGCDMMIIPNY